LRSITCTSLVDLAGRLNSWITATSRHSRRCAHGKNGRHRLVGLLRQSVFGRLAGYEDVNDVLRLCRDPVMR
jgi:hypothetical protein